MKNLEMIYFLTRLRHDAVGEISPSPGDVAPARKSIFIGSFEFQLTNLSFFRKPFSNQKRASEEVLQHPKYHLLVLFITKNHGTIAPCS